MDCCAYAVSSTACGKYGTLDCQICLVHHLEVIPNTTLELCTCHDCRAINEKGHAEIM